MATCQSCGSMVEDEARSCWQCHAAIARVAFSDTASGAPTLPVSALADAPVTESGPSPTMIGREIIGQYVIRGKLGEGGMGEVYLADQPAIGRQVAIKVVHAQVRARELDDHVARFRNEAKAAASLESPHIVQIFNWGELDDGTSFMAMEYLDGLTLAEVLREQGDQGGLAPELVVHVAAQICAALTEAHAAGIVHRDLKPSNIMLIERGDEPHFAKVLDFGVAKLEGADITRSGAMFGTPQYMSPEQLRAEGLDGRSDLYSLGVMLYEMLTGALPFSSPTAVGFITAHLHDTPPPLAKKTVPPALAEVVLLLLSKNPDQRPADAASLAAELRAALEGGSKAARQRVRRKAARRVVGAVVGLGLVVGLGVAGVQAWRWRVGLDEAHRRELELERARAEDLERQVHEQELAVAQIREEAKAMATDQMQTASTVREQRKIVQAQSSKGQPSRLDAKTRAALTRSRAELEAELREVLAARRIMPSEVDDVLRSHAARVAAVEAGELDEAELRDELISLVALYRRSFERLARLEDRPLAELEQRFMTMATATEIGELERREQLEAIAGIYRAQELPEPDRVFLRRLAVAKLIREQERALELAKADEAKASEAKAPGSKPEPKPGSAGSGDSGSPLPSADDEPETPPGGQAGSDGSLPSL